MKKSIVAIAVACAMVIRPTEHYLTAKSISSYDINPDQSMTPEAVHIRNGGEPWKTKNKRGRR